MITVLSKFSIKEDHVDMFKAAMIENQKQVRAEAGNEEMRLFQGKDDATIFFVYGRTKDQAGLNDHVGETAGRGIEEQVADALKTPPTTYFLGETGPAPAHHLKQVNPGDDDEILFFIFEAKPGYKDKLVERFNVHVTHTRQEEGNILFDFYTIENDDTNFVVYEHWRSKSAVWDFHMSQPYSIETGGLIGESLVGEMEEYLYSVNEIEPA